MDKIATLKSEYRELRNQFKALRYLPDQQVEVCQRWVKVARALADVDPRNQNLKSLEFALYWEAVSRCTVAQVNGDFKGAKKYAAEAADSAKHFRTSRRFFPNVFFDETEIASHDVYLEAVGAFQKKRFGFAAENFERWLILNRHRQGTGNTFFDRNECHHELCRALDAVDKGSNADVHWIQLDNLLDSADHSISRATRALRHHLEPLKALSISGHGSIAGGRATIEDMLRRASDEWRLLLGVSPPLTGKDRAAGLVEVVRLPTFIDVGYIVREVGEFWRYLLLQNLHNSLILKADYETRFHATTPIETKGSKVLTLKPFEIERLRDAELLNYIRSLIAARNGSDVKIFDKSAPLFWDAKRAVLEDNQATGAAGCQRFYDTLRSFPHVIRVTSCEPMYSSGSGVRRVKPLYKAVAERIWRYSQTDLTLETQGSMLVGSHYYMRPRWNRKLGRHYRHGGGVDPILETRVPEWMVLFERWASGAGPVRGEEFLRWCTQIEPHWRSVALRLLTKVIFLSEEEVREMWKLLYRNKIPADAKTKRARYVGLGRAGKSGLLQLYWLEQALSKLPQSERSFDFKTAFRTVDSLSHEEALVDSIVFIDDFIGTGQQAIESIELVLQEHSWLRTRQLFLCAIAGFEDGIREIEGGVSELSGRVFVAKTLAARDKAFSPENPLWDSETDREEARSWCERLGTMLLRRKALALGWKGSEALFAFHYNTPNNTLPIFWAEGKVNGEDWHPLLRRY